MKKVLLLALFLFSFLSLRAEKVVGKYTSFDREKRIEAYVNDKGTLVVFIQVDGKYNSEEVMIKVEGENNIKAMASAWREVKEKYIEWIEVAKKNNVSDFRKEYPISFPKCEIWWLGSKWRSSFSRDFLKPVFIVSSSSKMSTSCGGEAKDWENEYITQKWYLLFSNPNEIQTLIDALDVSKIVSILQEDTKADALFQ